MKLYRIKNWMEYYENNRSKTVKDLAWVKIPNRHDGEHYSRLMQHKDAAEIFASWILLIQVASRCHPRGTLLRSDEKPHDSESLALKTRAPKKWFDIALPVLVQMAWLEHVASGCQETDTQLPLSCQAGDEERKKERIEIEFSFESKKLSDELKGLMLRNDPKAKVPSSLDDWCNASKLLIEKDGREFTEAMAVLNWCKSDSFWSPNILSMGKFREKYPRLREQYLKKNTQRKSAPIVSGPAEDPFESVEQGEIV